MLPLRNCHDLSFFFQKRRKYFAFISFRDRPYERYRVRHEERKNVASCAEQDIVTDLSWASFPSCVRVTEFAGGDEECAERVVNKEARAAAYALCSMLNATDGTATKANTRAFLFRLLAFPSFFHFSSNCTTAARVEQWKGVRDFSR